MENVRTTVVFDEMVDALADVQRRILMLALLEHNPQDDAPAIIFDSDRDDTAVKRLVTMNHVHLPKLVDLGFIEWDRECHEVTKGANFDEIRPLLELLDDHEDELLNNWI